MRVRACVRACAYACVRGARGAGARAGREQRARRGLQEASTQAGDAAVQALPATTEHSAVRAGLDRLRCEPWRPWGRGEVLLGNEFDLDHGIF